MRQKDAPILRQSVPRNGDILYDGGSRFTKSSCAPRVSPIAAGTFLCVSLLVIADCWFVGTFFADLSAKKSAREERENFSNEQIFGQNLKEIKDFYA